MKFIEYLHSKISLFQHRRELRRIENDKSEIELGLQELYRQYLNKVIQGEILPQSKYGYQGAFSSNYINIFKNYKLNNPNLSQGEEKCLENMLTSKVSMWFVPYMLMEFDTKSLDLMEKLIETGIKQIDPSYNSIFLSVAIRIYGSPVNEYLLQRFKDSSMDTKRGIFRALYWLEPSFTEKQRLKKIELFLDEYQSTKSKKLRSFLTRNLPNELVLFPPVLKNKAEDYLKQVNKK